MEQEQKLELGRQIWDLRRAGYDRIEILKKLGISIQQLEDSLREFESQLAMDVGRAMEHYRELDNERIEQVVEALMPIALGDPDHPLETASDREYDTRLRASYAILGCIEARQKIIMASRPEKTGVREGSAEVLAWLQQLHAGTAKTLIATNAGSQPWLRPEGC
jgi:hypothetical protein